MKYFWQISFVNIDSISCFLQGTSNLKTFVVPRNYFALEILALALQNKYEL